MKKSCNACRDGKYHFRSRFLALRDDGVSRASSAVDRKSTGHTIGEL
jgi:hypothetical protein